MISGSVVVPFQKGPYFCRATRDERLGFLLPLEEVVVDALVLFIFCLVMMDDGRRAREFACPDLPSIANEFFLIKFSLILRFCYGVLHSISCWRKKILLTKLLLFNTTSSNNINFHNEHHTKAAV